MHARFPASFRCEKLAGDQLALLRGLGLFHCLTAVSKPIHEMHIARFGRLVERKPSEEWGFLYEDLVNSVRQHLPPVVDFVVGHVSEIATGPERQTVTLSNGERSMRDWSCSPPDIATLFAKRSASSARSSATAIR